MQLIKRRTTSSLPLYTKTGATRYCHQITCPIAGFRHTTRIFCKAPQKINNVHSHLYKIAAQVNIKFDRNATGSFRRCHRPLAPGKNPAQGPVKKSYQYNIVVGITIAFWQRRWASGHFRAGRYSGRISQKRKGRPTAAQARLNAAVVDSPDWGLCGTPMFKGVI